MAIRAAMEVMEAMEEDAGMVPMAEEAVEETVAEVGTEAGTVAVEDMVEGAMEDAEKIKALLGEQRCVEYEGKDG